MVMHMVPVSGVGVANLARDGAIYPEDLDKDFTNFKGW